MGGVIFLPFQLAFFSQIVAHIETLKKYYSISFVGCTEKNTLWTCTQKIPEEDMQQVFEKQRNQEDRYCIVTEQQIKQKDWFNIRSDDLLDIFNRIVNPATTRFIELTYVPNGDDRLGFTGLCNEQRHDIKRSSNKAKSKRKIAMLQNKKQCIIPASTLIHLERYIDTKWPNDNDTKNEFCKGMRRLLDVPIDLTVATTPVTACHEETMTEEVSSILDFVKQKYPAKFDVVKKALIKTVP